MQLIEGPKDQRAAPEEMPTQADSDDTLIALWLAGKADRTTGCSPSRLIPATTPCCACSAPARSAPLNCARLLGATCNPRDDAGQVTIFGKGGKTRVVLLTPAVRTELMALRGNAREDDPVFRSGKGGHLRPVQVHRLVKQAAARARIPTATSAHWLRHAHASHALDRGAPVSLVQATLGHASVATTGRYLHARPNDSSARYLPD
jgi:hypothetical protein